MHCEYPHIKCSGEAWPTPPEPEDQNQNHVPQMWCDVWWRHSLTCTRVTGLPETWNLNLTGRKLQTNSNRGRFDNATSLCSPSISKSSKTKAELYRLKATKETGQLSAACDPGRVLNQEEMLDEGHRRDKQWGLNVDCVSLSSIAAMSISTGCYWAGVMWHLRWLRGKLHFLGEGNGRGRAER